ncbi:MAG: response regulator [Hyphomicrobiales bacterium]
MLKDTDSRKLNVLILDDDKTDVHLLERQLAKIENYEFNTFSAKNGDEAIAICGYEDVDMVFSDFALAEGSSVDFLKNLRQLKASVPIILFSGMPGRSVRRLGFPAGAKAFLSKDDLSPTSIETAIDTAEHALLIEQQLSQLVLRVETASVVREDRFFDLCAVVNEFVNTLDSDVNNVPVSLRQDMNDLKELIGDYTEPTNEASPSISSASFQGAQMEEQALVRVFQNMSQYFFFDDEDEEPLISMRREKDLLIIDVALPDNITASSHVEGVNTLSDTAQKLGGHLDIKKDLSGTIFTIELPAQNAE